MKIKIKHLLIIIVAMVFLGGKTSDFLITSATKQNWNGGRPGSAGRTNYSFNFVAKKPASKLVIDQLWVKDEFLKIDRVIFMGGNDKEEFTKGDTIRYRAAKTNLPLTARLSGKEEKEKADEPKPPFEYEGAALIGYKIGEKRKYKVVEKFEEIKAILAP